jgi:HPt (histidine-containing phosphotransfer) domain-containing protein
MTAQVTAQAQISTDITEMPLDPTCIASLRELETADLPGVLTELIDSFLANADARLATMQSASETGNARTLYLIAHSMKGSAGNFGALRLSRLFAELERLAVAGNLVTAAPLLAQIEAEYRSVKQALLEERDRGRRQPDNL